MAMGKTIGKTKTTMASTTTSLFLDFFGNKKIQSGLSIALEIFN
jgi:hypothetical protein